eukprot:22463-Rhodomonas_salina.1
MLPRGLRLRTSPLRVTSMAMISAERVTLRVTLRVQGLRGPNADPARDDGQGPRVTVVRGAAVRGRRLLRLRSHPLAEQRHRPCSMPLLSPPLLLRLALPLPLLLPLSLQRRRRVQPAADEGEEGGVTAEELPALLGGVDAEARRPPRRAPALPARLTQQPLRALLCEGALRAGGGEGRGGGVGGAQAGARGGGGGA